MTTEIVRKLSIAEAGQIADAVSAKTVFERKLSSLSENTRRARRADLDTWAQFLEAAHVDIDDCDWFSDPNCWAMVTAGLIDGFVQWLLQAGYSINAVNRKLSSVKMFCRLSAKANTLPGDELARIQAIAQFKHGQGVEIDKQRSQNRVSGKKANSVELTSSQVRTLKSIEGDTPQAKRDRLLMCLMLDQALRVSEVVLLQIEQFDLCRSTFTFYRPKTKTEETHRLTNATLDALNDYLDAIGNPSKGVLIRRSRKGGVILDAGMSERNVTNRVNVLAKDLLDIDNLSAHDLRHSAATRAARGGTSVSALMGLGGWTSSVTAMRYVDKQKIANDGVKFEE